MNGVLAAAVFGLIVIVRMLILAGASADAQSFRRDEQPALFWGIVIAAVLVDGALFYFAFDQLGWLT